MSFSVLIQGFIVGFGAALPVGPLAIICIRRTLASSHRYGILTALGAATGDAIFAAVTIFGLSFVAPILTKYQESIRIMGGIFLLSVGIKTFYNDLTSQQTAPVLYGPFGTYITALLLTLANPVTILVFATAISSWGTIEPRSFYVLITGVFIGSASWFTTLSFGASALRSKLGGAIISKINKFSGAFIAFAGITVMLYGFLDR